MATFLATTSPAAGHLFPMVPGLLELRRRGHRVHLLAPEEHIDAVRSAGLRDVQPLGQRSGGHAPGGLRGRA